jgi:hypothetical protein
MSLVRHARPRKCWAPHALHAYSRGELVRADTFVARLLMGKETLAQLLLRHEEPKSLANLNAVRMGRSRP